MEEIALFILIKKAHLICINQIQYRVNLVATRNMIEIVSNLYQYPILMVDQKPNTEQKIFNLVHPITRQIIRKV